MAEVNKVSASTKEAIKRKSAYSLPDRPSEQGMKSEDIKKAFWQPVVDVNQSVISEIDRVVDEVNLAFAGLNEEELFLAAHPVGSYWITSTNVSPASTYGGVWEKIEGRFILGASSVYPLNGKGGEATHNHDYKIALANYNLGFDASANGLGVYNYETNSYVKSRVAGAVSAKGLYNATVETHQLSTTYLDGGNTSFSSCLPPYIAANIWYRIA